MPMKDPNHAPTASTSTRARLNEQSVYSQSVYYGADARKPAEDQIPSDPRYSFASYQDAIARPGDLVDSLRDGIQRIAKLLAGQLARVPR